MWRWLFAGSMEWNSQEAGRQPVQGQWNPLRTTYQRQLGRLDKELSGLALLFFTPLPALCSYFYSPVSPSFLNTYCVHHGVFWALWGAPWLYPTEALIEFGVLFSLLKIVLCGLETEWIVQLINSWDPSAQRWGPHLSHVSPTLDLCSPLPHCGRASSY